MKNAPCTLALAAVLASTGSFAQMNMDDMKKMGMGKKPAASATATHTTKATVKKADAKAGVVGLAHDPVPSLNWPAMSMNFRVKEKALWSKLAQGSKVEVEFVQQGDDFVITKVK